MAAAKAALLWPFRMSLEFPHALSALAKSSMILRCSIGRRTSKTCCEPRSFVILSEVEESRWRYRKVISRDLKTWPRPESRSGLRCSLDFARHDEIDWPNFADVTC